MIRSLSGPYMVRKLDLLWLTPPVHDWELMGSVATSLGQDTGARRSGGSV